jgi:hypothetical protein
LDCPIISSVIWAWEIDSGSLKFGTPQEKQYEFPGLRWLERIQIRHILHHLANLGGEPMNFVLSFLRVQPISLKLMFEFLYALQITLMLPTKGGFPCPHLSTNNGRRPEKVGILNLRKQLSRICNIFCSDTEKSALPGTESPNLCANY